MADDVHNLFYVPPEKISKEKIIIDGETVHHLKNVLRKKAGDTIYLADGNGCSYKAEILKITKSVIEARNIKKELHKRKAKIDLNLAFVPLKSLRTELILEKATELGVRKFLPFMSKFSVLTELSPSKLNRYQKMTISAMLQSRRYYTPEIASQKDLNVLLATFDDYDLVILADEKGESGVPLAARSILYIVGPEGGFDDSEIEKFKMKGVKTLSLGPNRLRSETAAIAGIAKILSAYKAI